MPHQLQHQDHNYKAIQQSVHRAPQAPSHLISVSCQAWYTRPVDCPHCTQEEASEQEMIDELKYHIYPPGCWPNSCPVLPLRETHDPSSGGATAGKVPASTNTQTMLSKPWLGMKRIKTETGRYIFRMYSRNMTRIKTALIFC